MGASSPPIYPYPQNQQTQLPFTMQQPIQQPIPPIGPFPTTGPSTAPTMPNTTPATTPYPPQPAPVVPVPLNPLQSNSQATPGMMTPSGVTPSTTPGTLPSFYALSNFGSVGTNNPVFGYPSEDDEYDPDEERETPEELYDEYYHPRTYRSNYSYIPYPPGYQTLPSPYYYPRMPPPPPPSTPNPFLEEEEEEMMMHGQPPNMMNMMPNMFAPPQMTEEGEEGLEGIGEIPGQVMGGIGEMGEDGMGMIDDMYSPHGLMQNIMDFAHRNGIDTSQSGDSNTAMNMLHQMQGGHGGDSGGGGGGGDSGGDDSGGSGGEGGGFGGGGGGRGGQGGDSGGGQGGDSGGGQGGDSGGGQGGDSGGGQGGDSGGGQGGDSGGGQGGGGHGGGDSGGGGSHGKGGSGGGGHHGKGGGSGHGKGGHHGKGGSRGHRGGGGHHGRGGGHHHGGGGEGGGHHSGLGFVDYENHHHRHPYVFSRPQHPLMVDPYLDPLILDTRYHHRTSPNAIEVYPDSPIYESGETISITAAGFIPFEPVNVQLYTLTTPENGGTFIITQTFKQRIGNSITTADETGVTEPKDLIIPELSGRTLAIVAIGQESEKRVTRKIRVV